MTKNQEILYNMYKEIQIIFKNNDIKHFFGYGSALGAVRESGFIPWDAEIDLLVYYKDYPKIHSVLQKNLSKEYILSTNETLGYELFFSRVHLKSVTHHDIHIDLFPLVGAPNEKTKQKRFINKLFYLNKIYYIKKLKPFSLYKYNYKRKMQAIFAKMALFLVPLSIIKNKIHINGTKYHVDQSNYVYTLGGSYKLLELFDGDVYSNVKYIKFEGINVPVPQKYDYYLKHIYGADYNIPKQNNYLK